MLENPKFLNELVYDLYENEPEIIRQHELRKLIEDSDGNYKGAMWEKVLEKYMPHTVRLPKNAWYRDFADGSDAKFCSISKYKDGRNRIQATISGVENKIGPLRVCMCFPGDKLHKVYFLFIPQQYYQTLSGHPIKISFSTFSPCGEIWDKFRCSFSEVIQPISNPQSVQSQQMDLTLIPK